MCITVIDLSRIAAARMYEYDTYMKGRTERDERAEILWNDFTLWLGEYADAMNKLTGTTETALVPLNVELNRYFGL